MDKKLLGRMRKYKFLYLLFLPVALYFAIFAYYPFIKGLILSFQENRLIGAKPFAGFANYSAVLADPDFIQSVSNSLIIGLADMGLYFVLSLLLAILLNEVTRPSVRKSVRTIAYLPYLFSWSVIGGVWALIFDLKGMANLALGFLGVNPVFFLAEPALARPLVIGMGVWRSVGYFALLYAVAMASISPSLFEAARIDGANRLKQIRKIIVPALGGTMKTIAVFLAIGVLTHFDEIYVMVNPANRQYIRTLLLYVYETGILNFKAGTASAGAVLVMAGTLIVTAATRRFIKYDEG